MESLKKFRTSDGETMVRATLFKVKIPFTQKGIVIIQMSKELMKILYD